MSLTPEQLAAYADGELDAAAARQAEAEIAASPDLQARLAAHRALKARLAAHFAPIAEQPVPARLRNAVGGGAGGGEGREGVADLAEAARARRERRLPRWTWGVVGSALAATLIVAMFGFGARSSQGFVEGSLADALDSQLVASQRPEAEVRILLSFRDAGGLYCRGFSEPSRAGIACREERGWRFHKIVGDGDGAPRSGEYRQAGSGEAQVLAAIQEMADGPALDAQAEREAMHQEWRDRNPRR